MDIKGAYDGIDHKVIRNRMDTWRKYGFYGDKTLELLIFLFSQYKMGLVEGKGNKNLRTCLVNVGFPQGSRLSCNGFNGVIDAVLKFSLFVLMETIRSRRPNEAIEEL